MSDPTGTDDKETQFACRGSESPESIDKDDSVSSEIIRTGNSCQGSSDIVPRTGSSSGELIKPTEDIWELVRKYKALQDREKELLEMYPDLKDDDSSSCSSEISNRSLIVEQLNTLGELDKAASEMSGSAHIPGIESSLQPPIELGEGSPSLLLALESIKVQVCTPQQLLKSVQMVSGGIHDLLDQ